MTPANTIVGIDNSTIIKNTIKIPKRHSFIMFPYFVIKLKAIQPNNTHVDITSNSVIFDLISVVSKTHPQAKM